MICDLCFHRCNLSGGQTGFCRARACQDGKIVPLNYGKITSIALDPIEKKPLRRFHPGSKILSVGSFGCNLRCPFCQNYEISMSGEKELETAELSPEALADKALELRLYGNIGVAYTYNEPLVGYEYVRDCASLVHERGMVNVLVTNGTIEEAPWRTLVPLIDAVNIDLRLSLANTMVDFYRRCTAHLIGNVSVDIQCGTAGDVADNSGQSFDVHPMLQGSGRKCVPEIVKSDFLTFCPFQNGL